MKTRIALALLAGCLALAARAAEPGPAAAPAQGGGERWLLAEFAWGDSKNLTYESVHYTDGFVCFRHKLREHCAFVKTRVDGEELLAKFLFADDKLWRIDILTPDLERSQAEPHLERVWKLLAAYVARFHGEAPEREPFPDWQALGPKEERVTHRWQLADQEIRIVVGRSPGTPEKWFTAARFIDPKWAKRTPPPDDEPAPGAR
jgi:hypothetical protein